MTTKQERIAPLLEQAIDTSSRLSDFIEQITDIILDGGPDPDLETLDLVASFVDDKTLDVDLEDAPALAQELLDKIAEEAE